MYERHDSHDSPSAVMAHIMDLRVSEFMQTYCLSKGLQSTGTDDCHQCKRSTRMSQNGRLYAFVAFAEPVPTANAPNRPVTVTRTSR
jgi:hypothetical protein